MVRYNTHMDKYEKIGTKTYNELGEEVKRKVNLNPRVREFKLVKIDVLKYDIYRLKADYMPLVDGAGIFEIANKRNLADVLMSGLEQGVIPKEIRIIRSKPNQGAFGIFFKE